MHLRHWIMALACVSGVVAVVATGRKGGGLHEKTIQHRTTLLEFWPHSFTLPRCIKPLNKLLQSLILLLDLARE